MIRVLIKNVEGNAPYPYIDFKSEELVDAYISQVIASQHWGRNSYEKQISLDDSEVGYSFMRYETRIRNEDQSITLLDTPPPEGTDPESIISELKFGTVPAEVTFEKVDVTTEYNQRTLDEYTLDQVALADSQVSTLLKGFDKTTQLGDCLAAMYVYFNVAGTFTPSEIAEAKVMLDSNYTLYSQAKAIQAQMYQNIAAKKLSLGL